MVGKMSKTVFKGQREIENNLRKMETQVIGKVVDAVDMTCVDFANHAKAGHGDNMAHANNRYRNRTTNLTNSIMSISAKRDGNKVIGHVSANQFYANWVESGTSINRRTGRPNRPYPFMVPAMFYSIDGLRRRLAGIL